MGGEVEGASVAISDKMPRSKAPYIKKRALRNKALSITFNDKDLKDYVGGFHKRKKKRRKEAQRNLQEKERLKRIGARKKRKLERESVQYGGVQPSRDLGPDENGDDNEQEEKTELSASVSGTKLYDNGDLKITVTTSEIPCEDDLSLREKTQGIPRTSAESEKKHNIPVQKKTFKVSKHKTMRKPQKKRNDKKGKKKKNQK